MKTTFLEGESPTLTVHSQVFKSPNTLNCPEIMQVYIKNITDNSNYRPASILPILGTVYENLSGTKCTHT